MRIRFKALLRMPAERQEGAKRILGEPTERVRRDPGASASADHRVVADGPRQAKAQVVLEPTSPLTSPLNVAVLEEVAGAAVAAVVGEGIAGEEPPHELREALGPAPEQEVGMVG